MGWRSMNMNEQKSGIIFHGVGIGSGCAAGPLRFFGQKARCTVTPHETRTPHEELERLHTAVEKTREALFLLQEKARREIGVAEAEIFAIHAMLLTDEDFSEGLEAAILDGASAEVAVETTVRTYCDMLKGLNDPYLSARAADMGDIAQQLLHHLSGAQSCMEEESEERYILVARDLTPSQTMGVKKDRLLGFVTFEGSSNSHTAILARAMGIPALVGVGEIELDHNEKMGLLDAASGTLTVSPSVEEQRVFYERQGKASEIAKEHERYLRSLINKPAITRGGHRMLIYANVGGDEEAASALLNGADGIGLLRSEFLYLSLDRYPGEEELFQSYLRIVSCMQGKRIVIRTLDIGADKQIGYFDLKPEENPALGFRGIRICLAREQVFKTQLRAILRASAYGNVSLMLPMVVSVEEVRASRRILEECKSELRREEVRYDEGLEFGIMIETPAAAVMSAELAKEVDFFSVGTNDLLQYTLAADRQNPKLTALCEENSEPVLRLIGHAAQAIHQCGGWIGICGELAADLRLTQRFADMEIDELSVSVPYLLGLREKVTECK